MGVEIPKAFNKINSVIYQMYTSKKKKFIFGFYRHFIFAEELLQQKLIFD